MPKLLQVLQPSCNESVHKLYVSTAWPQFVLTSLDKLLPTCNNFKISTRLF